MFLAINDDPKLVDRDGWNTLVIRAVGNREIVLLNGMSERPHSSSRMIPVWKNGNSPIAFHAQRGYNPWFKRLRRN